jgi:hypothetical protein
MSHVEHLSETIGPRPAATDAEEQAAHYIRDVFESRGLEAETQAFDTPRSGGWAFVVYHLLTIAAALLSHTSAWPALILGVAVAAVMWFDLDTRWGLTSLMPKGPSQNVIARHAPRIGRNERLTRVVVVAHYDSARTSLASSPGMARNGAVAASLVKGATFAVPILIVVRMLLAMVPAAKVIEPWAWYVTLLPAVYLLLPLLIDVHSEVFARFSPGANDNASGVAALLGLFERLVPEPDVALSASREVRIPDVEVSGTESGLEPDFVPTDSLLNYSPVQAPPRRTDTWTDDEDISWDTGVISGQTALGLDARREAVPVPRAETAPAPRAEAAPPRAVTAPPARPSADMDDIEEEDERSLRLFGAPAWKPPAAAAPRSESVSSPSRLDFGDLDEETAPFDTLAASTGSPESPAPEPQRGRPRRGLFGGRAAETERHGVRDWLGVGSDFDARSKGKDIGSWDNFEDDDDAGWKGGAASIEDESDPGYSASIAARIRRKVTMNVDRELVEKEVWFVATGAEETSQAGMKAFLAQYGHELRDAVIVNIDNVGTGAVSYVTCEGVARRREADRRLVGAVRRAVREAELAIKGREYRATSTDATAALARGFRALSIMAFDINGRVPNWHWTTDTADAVSEDNIQATVDLVSAIIKEL